jgi:hypothetical protein
MLGKWSAILEHAHDGKGIATRLWIFPSWRLTCLATPRRLRIVLPRLLALSYLLWMTLRDRTSGALTKLHSDPMKVVSF